jgi:amyotrophic lateral sclerosis 2 protein
VFFSVCLFCFFKVFTVFAETPADKKRWIDAFVRCVCEHVVSYDPKRSVARLASGVVNRLEHHGPQGGVKIALTLEQLRKRFVCFRVHAHPDFKDAVFEGECVDGIITGRGHFLCDDGRVYKGNFVEGYCEGYCEMTAPESPDGGRFNDRLIKGPWKRGKLDGIAFVSSYDGSTFCGAYVSGSREGHGAWVSDTDDRYVGGWKQNARHGYGVFEDARVHGSRYMGMWSSGLRSGRGVVVREGLYYEGDFVNDKLAGRGVLVSADDYTYEGEFSSDCQLQGRGTLTMPNGDTIEGAFKGMWEDRTGIQVTGTYFQHRLGSQVNSARGKQASGVEELTTHLRKPCVPVELKWVSIFEGEGRRGSNRGG